MTRLKLIGITLALPFLVVVMFIGEYYNGLTALGGTHRRPAKEAAQTVISELKDLPSDFKRYWKE